VHDITHLIYGLRILLVDSHQDSLDVATTILADYNANILAVNTTEQAYHALPIFQPHLLISELCLPEEDGYSLMRKVKKYMDDQDHNIPAIALTTQVSLEAKIGAFSAGFCRYIEKPYDFETLVKTVAQLAESEIREFQIC